MEMSGEYLLPAPRALVWAALNDPDVLRRCIVGCETITKESDTSFSAKITAKVGPVKASFGGKVTLSDLDPPKGYTITGEGAGGAAGFAKGGAQIALEEQGEGTLLRYAAQGQVGGKLAQIGSRLIDGTARKLSEEFFTRFAEIVSAEAAAGLAPALAPDSAASSIEAEEPDHVLAVAAAAQPTDEAPEAMIAVAAMTPEASAEAEMAREAMMTVAQPPEGTARTPAKPQSGLAPVVWVTGLVIAVAALLWYFVGR